MVVSMTVTFDADQVFAALADATRRDIVPEVDPKLIRPTDEPIIWADCTKLKLATGWEPAISLDQTIDDMLSYWRQKPERALVV